MGNDCCSSRAPPVDKLPSWERARINTILKYWFPPKFNRHTGYIDDKVTDFWLQRTTEDDWFVEKSFKKDLLALQEGQYEEWENDRDGRLAIIILCDQFSRRIYRGNQQAFYFDHIALDITKKILQEPLEF